MLTKRSRGCGIALSSVRTEQRVLILKITNKMFSKYRVLLKLVLVFSILAVVIGAVLMISPATIAGN